MRDAFANICPHFVNILCPFALLQKVEGRVASDQDLKLTELLRYYMRDIQAAKVRHGNPSFLCTVAPQVTTGRPPLLSTMGP